MSKSRGDSNLFVVLVWFGEVLYLTLLFAQLYDVELYSTAQNSGVPSWTRLDLSTKRGIHVCL